MNSTLKKYAESLTFTGSFHIFEFKSRKYFLKKRSMYSEKDAIKKISKYGISDVILVSDEYIVETFVDFNKVDLDFDEYEPLLKKIHSNKKNGLVLVHGDFSKYNTTKYAEKNLLFDYEHAHWGNCYEDLGRIILRECPNVDKAMTFLQSYYGHVPNNNTLREGLFAFGLWQHYIRKEKNAEFDYYPKIRANRVLNAADDVEVIINEFKRDI